MKKRILAFLMCLCLCVGLLPGAALAADTYTVTPQFSYPDGVTSGGAIRVLNADGSTTDYTDGEVVTMTVGETCRFVVLPLADGTEGSISGMSGDRPGEETIDGVTYTTLTGQTTVDIRYGSDSGPGDDGPGSGDNGDSGDSGEAGTYTVGFSSVAEEDGVYIFSGCLMDCSFRIEFETDSGEGGSGEPGSGEGDDTVGPPDPPAEDWTVDFELVYDGTEPITTGGGINVYNEDGSVRETVTASGSITVPGGTKFLCLPLEVDGLAAAIEGQNGTEGGLYARYESGTVTVVYTVDDGTGDSGDSGSGSGDSSSFYIETKDMAADGSTVGATSAVLTAIYSAPSSDTSSDYYRIKLVFGTDKENMGTYHRYVGGEPGGEAYLEEYSLEIKGLLPDTTYYYQAYMVYRVGTDEAEQTIYGEIKSFTTDTAAIPCYEISPIDWSADVQEVSCSVTDTTDAAGEDLEKLVFTTGDEERGSYLLSFTVDRDGTYHFDSTYNGVIGTGGWQDIVMVRLYTRSADGGLVTENGGKIDGEICWFALNGNEGNEDHTEQYVDLKEGVEYYLLLDTDGETVDISVSYANWMASDAEFSLDVTVAYHTGDSRPACMRAMAVYSVSEYYNNGYGLYGTYALRSEYEETGKMSYVMGQLMMGMSSAQTDALMEGWMNYCIPGLEYVYELSIVDNTTGEVLAATGVQSFTADMPDMYSLQPGENYNTQGSWKFGQEGYMYKFRTGTAGYYHIGVNNADSVVEFYNAQGELLKRSTSGSFWSSASCELEADTLYYIYISCRTEIKPIVTVSQPNGSVAADESVVAVDATGADTARATLEDVLNQLTKDGSGNPTELPGYVETDEAGEAALRAAIETGEALTAEVTGTELTEEDVDASAAEAMEKEAQTAADAENAEALLYLDLSVLLTQADEEIAKLTETEEEITFRIPISDELAQAIAGREVYVIRYHEGEAETLKAELSPEGDYICFSSDRFSTYGLFAAVEEDDIPKTVDLIALMKHIVGVKLLENPQDYDYNNDGVVDILDVIRAVRYLAGEDVELN